MSYEQTLALATAGFGLTDAHRPLVADLIEAGTLAVLTGIDLEPRDRFFLELWHRHVDVVDLVEMYYTPGDSEQSNAADPRQS